MLYGQSESVGSGRRQAAGGRCQAAGDRRQQAACPVRKRFLPAVTAATTAIEMAVIYIDT